MTGKDALKQQYGFFYLTLKLNLDGFGAEQSLEQPNPGGNCANWILAHTVSVHNAAMGLVNQEPVWDHEALLGRTEPVAGPGDAYDWDTMVSKLIDSEARFMAGLDALEESDLDEDGFTDPFGNATTRGELLNLLAVHQNYHTGQLGLSRRLVGLPGAIGNPSSASS